LPLPAGILHFFNSIPKMFFGYHEVSIPNHYDSQQFKSYA
jgi:hypothetical protein